MVVTKPPSMDMMPGLTDDKEVIGISYKKMDLILMALEKGWKVSDIAEALEIKKNKVVYIKKLIKRSEHMRKIYKPKIII